MRQPKPAKIYREEMTHSTKPTLNSTRTTNSAETFERWRSGALQAIYRDMGIEVRYFVGSVEWSEV